MSLLSFQQPPRLPFRKHKTTPTCPGGLALSQHQQLAAPSSLQLRQGGPMGALWGHPAGPQRSPRKAALRTLSRRPGRSRPKPAAPTSIAPKTQGHGPAPPRCPQRLRACPGAEREGGNGLRYKGRVATPDTAGGWGGARGSGNLAPTSCTSALRPGKGCKKAKKMS